MAERFRSPPSPLSWSLLVFRYRNATGMYNHRCCELVVFQHCIRFRLLNQYKQSNQYKIIACVPITLASARHSQETNVLRPLANKGFNTTKHSYGFKLHVIDDQRFPLNWKNTAASVDDYKMTEELLLTVSASHILTDGGYLSESLKTHLFQFNHIDLWTSLRKHMTCSHYKIANSNLLKNLIWYIKTFFNNLNSVACFKHPRIRDSKRAKHSLRVPPSTSMKKF